MKQSIRWGIWGTGVIASKVARDLRLATGNTLHAVASRTPERAMAFASEHDAARHYDGLAQLLADADVDAVYIATPNHLHLQDCLACIAAGKPLLCEKPFALNVLQAQQIVDAARAKGVFCMEAMWTRFLPAVAETKRLVQTGALGPIRLIQGNFAHQAPADSGGRLYDRTAGGGVLLDLGVYLISVSQYLLGKPDSVSGSATMASSGVDEQSSYQLRYDSGALVDLSASLCVRGSNELFIAGETGSIRLCEPFYAAYRLKQAAYTRPTATPEGSHGVPRGSVRKLVSALRNAPLAESLRRRASSALNVLRGEKTSNFHFSGFGYQFEIMEVGRCVRGGKTESDVMPLDDSLSVMRTMDELRAQWGLVYPGE